MVSCVRWMRSRRPFCVRLGTISPYLHISWHDGMTLSSSYPSTVSWTEIPQPRHHSAEPTDLNQLSNSNRVQVGWGYFHVSVPSSQWEPVRLSLSSMTTCYQNQDSRQMPQLHGLCHLKSQELEECKKTPDSLDSSKYDRPVAKYPQKCWCVYNHREVHLLCESRWLFSDPKQNSFLSPDHTDSLQWEEDSYGFSSLYWGGQFTRLSCTWEPMAHVSLAGGLHRVAHWRSKPRLQNLDLSGFQPCMQ